MDERADRPPPRIALTGATGFIGYRLQRALLDAGCVATALVRPGSRRRGRLLPGVEARAVALDDRAALDSALATADYAVYCAGSVRGGAAADFHAANVAGVAAFADSAARAMPRPRVMLLSSLAASRPQLSDYAASKRAGEAALERVPGLAWMILRPPAVYGPGDREMRPLLASIRRGLALQPGPRGQRLSLLFVDDLARAVCAAIEHFEACRGGTFEIHDGHPHGYGWPEIIAQVRTAVPVLPLRVPRAVLAVLAAANRRAARRLGYRPMLTPGKVRELFEVSWLCDNRAFTTATGWRPCVELRDGARATFAPS